MNEIENSQNPVNEKWIPESPPPSDLFEAFDIYEKSPQKKEDGERFTDELKKRREILDLIITHAELGENTWLVNQLYKLY